MSVHVYLTSPSTGRVHLVPFDRLYGERDPRSYCGLPAAALTEGDETASGYLSTCSTCRRAADLPHKPPTTIDGWVVDHLLFGHRGGTQ